MVLNQRLFDILKQRFGKVSVSKLGQPMTGQYVTTLLGNGITYQIEEWGESYLVNCPFCQDTRQLLSISHRYGEPDPLTGNNNIHLVKCFHRDCPKMGDNRRKLYHRILGLVSRFQRSNGAPR